MQQLLCICGLLLFGLMSCTGKEANSSKNLLFILTDEQRYDTSAPYGNNKIKTPHLNRLGEEGIVFTRAYVSQPVCSPARSTLLTGLYPHATGVTSNNIPLDSTMQTLPEMMADDAYVSAFIGKWHLGNELDAWQGFDLRISSEDIYTRTDTTHNSDYHHWLLEKGYVPEGANFSRDFAADLPYEHTKSKFIEEKALEFLRAHKNQPFLLYTSFLEPHSPNNGPFNTLHDTAWVELDTTYFMPPGEGMPLRYFMKRGYTYATTTREMFTRYWGLVHQVDLSVGVLLNELEDLGMADHTVVVFTSEHGKMMRKFGLTGKTVMYDVSSRVPWMMRIPGVEAVRIEGNVSQIDLVPTIMDAMGVEVPDHLQGQSLLPVIRGESPLDRPIFMEWNPFSNWERNLDQCPEWAEPEACSLALQTAIRTVVTQEGWKLNWSRSDSSQLFYLKTDSLEMYNLYQDEAYAETREALEQLILDWQHQVEDTITLR